MAYIRSSYLHLGLILILGFVLRLSIADINFWHDETHIVAAAQEIVEKGIPQMDSGFVYSRSFPTTYTTAFMIQLFGMNETLMRIPVVIIGTLSILLFYFMCKYVTNHYVALFMAFLVAISPWHVLYSSFLREYIVNALLFFSISALVFFYLKQKNNAYLIGIVLLTFLFSLFTDYVFIVITILPVIVAITFMKKTQYRASMYAILVIAIALCISYFFVRPTISSVFSSVVEPVPYVVTQSNDQPQQLVEVIESQLRRLVTLSVYFPVTFIQFFPFGILVIGIGSVLLYRKRDVRIFFPLILFTFLAFLSVINPIAKFQPRYIFPVSLIYFISLGISLEFIYKQFPVRNARYGVFFAFILGLLSIDFYNIHSITTLSYGTLLNQTIRVSESYLFLPDNKSAVQQINMNASADDVVITLQPQSTTPIYLDDDNVLDYYLSVNPVEYERISRQVGDQRLAIYHNKPYITSVEELQAVISKATSENRTVYIISSNYLEQERNHIDSKTKKYIQNQAQEVISTSNYTFADIYVFK